MAESSQKPSEPQKMQRFFRCDWPNGDVSFVLAHDESDAIFELDEVAAAERSMLTEVDTFQVHLALKRLKRAASDAKSGPKWAFVLEGFGELTEEYIDLTAAVARKKTFDRAKDGRDPIPFTPPSEDAHGKPLVQMGDIEFRNAFDELERGPDSLLGQMLCDVRTGRSGRVIRTAAVVLVLRNGEERPIAAFSEYGDGEGREAAACCIRYCDHLGVLMPEERLERLLVETRIPELTTTRSPDLIGANSGLGWLEALDDGDDATLRKTIDSGAIAWGKLITDARKLPTALLVSLGMLTLPDGTTRSFCENGELGDNGGRMAVADNIRTSRRVGLLREGEVLTRHMLEIRLQPLQSVLKLDPLREPRRRRGNGLS